VFCVLGSANSFVNLGKVSDVKSLSKFIVPPDLIIMLNWFLICYSFCFKMSTSAFNFSKDLLLASSNSSSSSYSPSYFILLGDSFSMQFDLIASFKALSFVEISFFSSVPISSKITSIAIPAVKSKISRPPIAHTPLFSFLSVSLGSAALNLDGSCWKLEMLSLWGRAF